MNNKIRLSHVSMIVSLAVVLSLMTAYVPMLGILSLVIPVPYAIIGTLSNKKYSILSIVVTFLILMFSVSPIYSVNICILSVIPGIIIGNIAKKGMGQKEYNKFEPIYGGIIAFVISTIVFFFVAKIIFNINLITELMGIMESSIQLQSEIIKDTGSKMIEGLSINDLLKYIGNMIPTMLFFKSMISAFITYYIEVIILKRIKIVNFQTPKFTEFYLPGNAITVSFSLYLLVLLLEIMNVNLHTELIMINLQMVFNAMFIIQGIAVCIHYVKTNRKKGSSKLIFFGVIFLCITGFMGISFIGMLDSIIDFRKVRSYKSI
ncbi:DUF2232 domain-containing protein [Romboutsia maritimum]|uniref:DUF2232 domain-containing protein n=1 Tax=Romboutsia maritimum TaxID=2020948 RepID=A0A371ISK6_9FIRM|nr:DUF2232 domain-containing protein [Romboutsia maritimum]RDY23449.1 DUF2232 domain-containing protein [Romboutsia maritimum]